MTRFGYFLSCEEYDPDELVEQARLAEQAGFDSAVDQRPLPPVERRAGAEPVRVAMIGALSQVCRLPVTTAVTCPTVRTAPGDRRAGGGHRPPCCSARAASPSAWAPVRRSTSTSSATAGPARRAAGDARGGRRGHPRAVDGRVRLPPRPALHRRERPHLHAARRAAADLRVGLRRRRRSTWRCASATASSPPSPTPSAVQTLEAKAGADKPDAGGLQGVRRGHRGRGRSTIAHRLWANAGLPGRALPGAAVARSTSSRPASWSPEDMTREQRRLRARRRRARRGVRAVRRRRLRRGLRRQHGPALRRPDRGLRRRRAPAAARLALAPRRPQSSYSGSPSTSAGFASWPSRPRVRRSSFISASKTWRCPSISSSRARWCRPFARA